MAAQHCPICNEKRMEYPLSMSRAQKLRDSPWFYSVYCKVCGHIDGLFAQDVFPNTPSAPSAVLISIAHR
jgi:hypothetical protein